MPFKKTDKGEFWHEKGRIWTASSRVIAEKKAAEVGGTVTEYPYKVRGLSSVREINPKGL